MLRWIDITSLYKRRKKRLFEAFAVTTLHSLEINCNWRILFHSALLCWYDFFRHIAAIVNRQWLKFACCFLPINKAIDPCCCHQFWHTWIDRSPLVVPHLLVCVAVSKSHLYKWTWCLTVAVVVVLHYLHLTNASTTFSPFIFKYCWHIWRFYVLFVFVKFLFYELWQCHDVYILPTH